MVVSIIANVKKFSKDGVLMERKEEIILATLELASENGLKSISMAQIAEILPGSLILRSFRQRAWNRSSQSP